MSSAPNSLATILATESTLSCVRTSSLMRLAAAARSRTLSSATSVAITLPPSFVNASAIARPMPCPPAVTSATLPCSLLLILSSCGAVEYGEAYFLNALRIEVLGRQPAFEVALAHRPLAVEHGKPRVIAIAALGDDMLTERALVNEPITQRRTTRPGIVRVAFPFIAAIAERLECVTRQQILSFGAERGALQGRRIHHVPDLDHPIDRNDAQQRDITDGVILRIDDRIGVRILGCGAHGDKRGKLGDIAKRPGGRDEGPDLIMSGEHRPQIGPVVGPQFLQTTVTALQGDRTGAWPGLRIRDGQPDRLAGHRMRFGCSHAEVSFFRSSLKNLFSSGLLISPAKPSNLPSRAISVATRMKACMATRASEPPTLMRRTPIPARSATVKPKAPLLRKLTGLGATALTTASICSRVLMPGA